MKRPSRRPTRIDVAVLAEERDLLAAELDPVAAAGARAGSGGRAGRSAAGRLTEDPDHRFSTKIRPRSVNHLDAADEAAFASEIKWKRIALPDQPVDAEILAEAVVVDQPDRHHVHVVPVGDEPKLAESALAIPVFAVTDVDHVAIDPKAYLLLAEQDPIRIEATASTLALRAAVVVPVPSLGHRVRRDRAGQNQRTGQRCGHLP